MPPTVSERRVVWVLFFLQFTHVLDFVILMPLGPQLMRLFSLSANQFSLLVSSYTFSAAIAGLVASLYLDRFERKNALIMVYSGFLLGTALCALANSFAVLLAARIVAGAFGGLVAGMLFALIADFVAPERRGWATGVVMSGFASASVVGVPVGLWIANHLSWQATFASILGVGVVVLAQAISLLPKGAEPVSGTAKPALSLLTLFTLLRQPSHQLALLLTTTLVLGAFSIIPFISPFLVANVGVTEADLPILYLCGGAVTFFSSRAFGRLADRYGKIPVFRVLVSLSLLPIMAITHLRPLPLPFLVPVFVGFMVFVSGRFVPAMAVITSVPTAETRSGFLSLHSAAQQFASGLASLIGGAIIFHQAGSPMRHFNRLGYWSTAMALCAIFIATKLAHSLKRTPQSDDKLNSHETEQNAQRANR